MISTRIVQLFLAGLLGLICANTPVHAFDPARGVRESITQSVRDDVRRQIRAREIREQRFRDSRAEFRSHKGNMSKRKIRMR